MTSHEIHSDEDTSPGMKNGDARHRPATCFAEVAVDPVDLLVDVEPCSSDQAVLIPAELTPNELNRDSISEYSAAFLITNAALGAGLLNFPRAFHEAGGLVPGNVMHMFFLLATVASLYIMAHIAAKYSCRTYQEMVTLQCGPAMGHFTSACIAIYCLITCITFLIIVGDQTDRFFASYYGPDFCSKWWLSRQFSTAVAGVVVLWLSFYRDMAKLVTMGYVGSVFMVYLVLVIAYEWCWGGYTPGRVVVLDVRQLGHLFDVLPTVCFGYQCHVSSVPIYHSIRGKTRGKYFKACTLAMLCCATVYSVAANCGYLTFGSNVADDLLLSYDASHRGAGAISVAVVALALKSVATYPVLMYCVREAVVSFYVSARNMTAEEALRSEPPRRYAVVLVLWSLSVAAALLTSHIDVVVRLLGSLAAFFIFVLPGSCLFVHSLEPTHTASASLLSVSPSTSLCRSASSSLQTVAALALITLGVFTFGLSASLALQGALAERGGGGVAPLCIVNGTVVSSAQHFGLVFP